MSSTPAEGGTGLPSRALAGQTGQRSLCAQDQVSVSHITVIFHNYDNVFLIETRSIEIFNEPLFHFVSFKNYVLQLKAIVIEGEIEMFSLF